MHIIKTQPLQEGDGVDVRRLFPFHRDRLVVDPFVLWDDFSIAPGAGFPTHAHRGFEAITYLFEGEMNHTDNLGNNSTVTGGGAQRFTAGKGIQHSEMPGNSGTTTGIQLWINLPQSLKGIDPEYQQIDAGDIPQSLVDGVTVREIAGHHSHLQLKTPVYYAEVIMDGASSYRVEATDEMQGFIYLQQGQATIENQPLQTGEAMQLSQGESATITATQNSRLMVVLGKPHLEAVRLTGGFVD